MGKALVAYFSVGQETAKVAKMVAGVEHADLFEIVPSVPYKPGDMEWLSKTSRVTIEQKDYFCRPKMAVPLANAGDYDTIFFGFPIWMFDAPKIIYTFLESFSLQGKTLVPFATSGGSGRRETEKKNRQECIFINKSRLIPREVTTGRGDGSCGRFSCERGTSR